MAQGFMLNVANVTGGAIDGGNPILLVPLANSSLNAQPSSPYLLQNGGLWGNQYVEASGNDYLNINLYTNYGNGISSGSVNIVFDSNGLSEFSNGQVYVNGFQPLQLTGNTWVYPMIQMASLGGSYNWTLGMLYLMPVLDPTNLPSMSRRARK